MYRVRYENEAGTGSDNYDIVVIATPLHLDNSSTIAFEGFDPPIDVVQGSFQPTVVSLVHGYLNSSYFGFPDPKLFPFANILTTDFPASSVPWTTSVLSTSQPASGGSSLRRPLFGESSPPSPSSGPS